MHILIIKNELLKETKSKAQFLLLLGVITVVTLLWFPLTTVGQDTVILGSPTINSNTANLLTINNGKVYFEYGTYSDQTTESNITAGIPLEKELTGLQQNTLYYYRMNFKQSGSSDYVIGDGYTFHTKRSAGSAFTFTVQADPHQGDKNFNVDLYHVALQNQLNDNPDFFIDLCDTFMTEKYYPDTEQGAFDAAYDHRQHFDIIAKSAPLFLVNGNHEGESGLQLDGTSLNMAIFAKP